MRDRPLGRVAAAALRLINRAGARLTYLGERFGLRWLTYNPFTFLYYLGRSLADADGVITAIQAVAPEAGRWADIGSGAGGFAAVARRRGVHVEACEHSPIGRALARALGVQARPFDLNRSPPAMIGSDFDLVYCFEVAEHLPPELGERLVEFVATRGNLIVFTAAPPGQGGTGHINERPASYWITRFRAAGLEADDRLRARLAEQFRLARVAPWFATNVLVFRRPSFSPSLDRPRAG